MIMAPHKAPIPPAAKPNFGDHFDAWNSSATGHQRAENRLGGSTGWRQSRNMKLSFQYRSGSGGGKRISDTVGAGSKDWDETAKALISDKERAKAKRSIEDILVNQDIKSVPVLSPTLCGQPILSFRNDQRAEELISQSVPPEITSSDISNTLTSKKPGIFDGLVIYVNGSTYPLVSDHKLKHLLAENGARLSIHLGRRQVTHVILGRPNSGIHAGTGAGGGLAATKIQKEIQRVGGCGIKFVGVEWILESLKLGKRLPETRFANLKTAAKNQESVYGWLSKQGTT